MGQSVWCVSREQFGLVHATSDFLCYSHRESWGPSYAWVSHSRWWSFTEVWVTTSSLRSSGLLLVFWPITTSTGLGKHYQPQNSHWTPTFLYPIHLLFCTIVKFQFFAIFLVDYLPRSVVSGLILFVTSACYVISGSVSITT